jgi:hypothetical protein
MPRARFCTRLTTRLASANLQIDAPEWRLWINSLELRMRHGAFLEDLTEALRQAALELLHASLSPSGFEQVRAIMRLNRVLGYYLSVSGHPGSDDPWGWQLDGHHLNINCVVLRDQMVVTPSFMGAEPRVSDRQPFPEARAFDREQHYALHAH